MQLVSLCVCATLAALLCGTTEAGWFQRKKTDGFSHAYNKLVAINEEELRARPSNASYFGALKDVPHFQGRAQNKTATSAGWNVLGRDNFERLERNFMGRVTVRDPAKCDQLGAIYTKCNVQRDPHLHEAALYSLGSCIGGISATNPVAFEQENSVIAIQHDCAQVEYILSSRHPKNVDRFKIAASSMLQAAPTSNAQLVRSMTFKL